MLIIQPDLSDKQNDETHLQAIPYSSVGLASPGPAGDVLPSTTPALGLRGQNGRRTKLTSPPSESLQIGYTRRYCPVLLFTAVMHACNDAGATDHHAKFLASLGAGYKAGSGKPAIAPSTEIRV